MIMLCTNVSFYRHALNVILAPQVHSWYAADIPTNCDPVAHHTSSLYCPVCAKT